MRVMRCGVLSADPGPGCSVGPSGAAADSMGVCLPLSGGPCSFLSLARRWQPRDAAEGWPKEENLTGMLGGLFFFFFLACCQESPLS